MKKRNVVFAGFLSSGRHFNGTTRGARTRHHADAPAAGEPFSDALIAGMLVGARSDVALAFNAWLTARGRCRCSRWVPRWCPYRSAARARATGVTLAFMKVNPSVERVTLRPGD